MAYNGQRVTFTCTINIVVDHRIVIRWRSEDYIGTGVRDILQVTSDDPIGSTDNISTTEATLISGTRSNNGLITVVTELQLTASAMYPISHISCRANDGPMAIRMVTFFTFVLPGNAY
jgi:hypothetical protein